MSVKVWSPFMKGLGCLSRALMRPRYVHDHKSTLLVSRSLHKIKDIVCVVGVSTNVHSVQEYFTLWMLVVASFHYVSIQIERY